MLDFSLFQLPSPSQLCSLISSRMSSSLMTTKVQVHRSHSYSYLFIDSYVLFYSFHSFYVISFEDVFTGYLFIFIWISCEIHSIIIHTFMMFIVYLPSSLLVFSDLNSEKRMVKKNLQKGRRGAIIL